VAGRGVIVASTTSQAMMTIGIDFGQILGEGNCAICPEYSIRVLAQMGFRLQIEIFFLMGFLTGAKP
jgi:hypothetical protein